MISNPVKIVLADAVENPDKYGSGKKRRQLQASFELMLNEVSLDIFDTPCISRINFRKQLNLLDLSTLPASKKHVIESVRAALQADVLLYDKSYNDKSPDIQKFVTNHIAHILLVI